MSLFKSSSLIIPGIGVAPLMSIPPMSDGVSVGTGLPQAVSQPDIVWISGSWAFCIGLSSTVSLRSPLGRAKVWPWMCIGGSSSSCW